MTNGYSLAREVWGLGKGLGAERERAILDEHYEELGSATLGEALTAPHPPFWPLLQPALPYLKGIAHITGGGIPGNLPRILREGVAARLDLSSWETPGLFRLIQREGGIADAEMYRAFNMGVGMIVAVAPSDAAAVEASLPGSWRIGEVVERATDGRAVIGVPQAPEGASGQG
jgi:phosphoribosylformylglycinamidine cyclo-ligase